MKLFEQITPEQKEERQPAKVEADAYIKENLMKSVDRDEQTRELIRSWLFSFEGALTRKMFDQQMRRLDHNAEVAAQQLAKAKGRRTIPLPPPEKKPALTQPLIAQMVDDMYVAVCGRKYRTAIRDAVRELKGLGDVYVLQVEELILQFKSYDDKGTAPQMIDKAIECDFLVVVDLEMPIHIEWHVHEAISRIGRRREAAKKPMISTWNRFNDVNDFFERFKVYSVD